MSTRRQFAGLGLDVASAALTIAFLIGLAGLVDQVVTRGAGLAEVRSRLVVLGVLVLVRATCVAAASVMHSHASEHVRTSMRSELVEHLAAVGPAAIRRERTGEVAATVGPAVDALDPYIVSFLPARLLTVIVPAMVMVTIAIIDPWTTLILVFTGPMLVLMLAVIGRRTSALAAQRFDEMGWLRSFYLDMIRGLATLKAFRRADDGAEMIEAVSTRHGSTTMDLLRTAFQTSLVMEWAATASVALVAVEVSFRVVEHDLAFGTALAVLVVTPEFFLPFRRLAIDYHAGQSGEAALERISDLLAVEPAVAAPSTRARSTVPTGDIELRDVAYSYVGSERSAVAGIDLTIGDGETVALVGPSGAGKSTIAMLVMRFASPDVGTITLGGHPLADIDLAAWRRGVAWVPQPPTVFAGTVADNIALAVPGASMSEIEAAAAFASADQFIRDLPDRYDTRLGEGGLRLSEGQRQRLAIARAALRDAPIVVLDEFTAHLDAATERSVLEAMRRLLSERTALVIAHRGATAAEADRVVTLRDGRIVESA